MTDKTPDTLDRLWNNIPTGHAPIPDILSAGQAAKRRNRRTVIAGAAAVTALVIGGGFVTAQNLTGTDTSRENTFVADGADGDLTVKVEGGVSTDVPALRDRTDEHAAVWDPDTQTLIYVSRFGYSGTCPPEGTAVETQDGSLSLKLTTPDTDEPCTADDQKVTATITGFTAPPPALRVAEYDQTFGVPVRSISELDKPTSEDVVRVPAVIGMSVTRARSALEGAGLAVVIQERPCGLAARCVKGVAATTPSAGSRVTMGSTVTVTVMRDDASQTVLLTHPTSAFGRDALVTGTLTLLGNCVGIGDAVAIWPNGTTVLNDAPLTLDVPGLGTVRGGDEVNGAGGYFDVATDNVDVDIPASCGTTQAVTFRVE